MLPVMQVGRVRPGAPPEHDVLHPVGGGLGQARPTNNIGIHGNPRRHNLKWSERGVYAASRYLCQWAWHFRGGRFGAGGNDGTVVKSGPPACSDTKSRSAAHGDGGVPHGGEKDRWVRSKAGGWDEVLAPIFDAEAPCAARSGEERILAP
ncbi:MAG: hypothetical protein FJ404_06000 [Verrucomicrobia bacterium]|nr:hypothetical protein [Verrucomicrobiota bacterium]